MRPLQNVVVLDFTRVLSGPFATQQLVDLGARVLKLEKPRGGDDTRAFGPPFLNGESSYFMSVNRGKESVALDLKRPEGVALARRLVARADVVVENFRPGTLTRLGLDLGELRAEHPKLITCAISGYGSAGDERFSARGGYDAVIQAISGLMSLTGEPDGGPTKVGVALADMVAGLYAAQAILTALYHRERTGEGHHLDISMQDALLSLLTYQAGIHFATGREPKRMGNAHPSICPYETLAAKDGPFALAVGNDDQFRRFAALVGHPEWCDDERFATNSSRVAHREALMEVLAPAFAIKTRDEWQTLLDKAGIPGGPVLGLAEALSHPQVQARGTVLEHEHPTAGPVRTIASPVRFEGPTTPLRSGPPPRLGEHTDAILAELGVSAKELDALRSAGVVVG